MSTPIARTIYAYDAETYLRRADTKSITKANDPTNDGRRQIAVDARDAEQWQAARHHHPPSLVMVTDHNTGDVLHVLWAACGLSCRCAAVWRPIDQTIVGRCDCGIVYDATSRHDHDADTGQCWACSDREPEMMTDTEWLSYLRGH